MINKNGIPFLVNGLTMIVDNVNDAFTSVSSVSYLLLLVLASLQYNDLTSHHCRNRFCTVTKDAHWTKSSYRRRKRIFVVDASFVVVTVLKKQQQRMIMVRRILDDRVIVVTSKSKSSNYHNNENLMSNSKGNSCSTLCATQQRQQSCVMVPTTKQQRQQRKKLHSVRLFGSVRNNIDCNADTNRNNNHDRNISNQTFFNTYSDNVSTDPVVFITETSIAVAGSIDSTASTTITDTKILTEKNVMLLLLFLIAFLSALDRVAMSVALVPMSNEFPSLFTDTIKGSVSSFFSLGYGLMIVPAGVLTSLYSSRTMLSIGIALWSFATFCTPLSILGIDPTATKTSETSDSSILTMIMVFLTTIGPLFFTRALVGIGESFVLPTAQKCLSVWTTPNEKGFAIALLFSGFKSGTIAAYLLSPIVMDLFTNGGTIGNWRSLFYTYGLSGLVLLILWLLLAKDAPSIHQEEHKLTPRTDQPTVKSAEQLDRVGSSNSASLSLLSSSSATLSTAAISSTPVGNVWNTETTNNSYCIQDSLQVTDNGKITRSTISNTITNKNNTTTIQSLYNDAPWKQMIQSKGVWAMLLAHCSKNYALYNTLSWSPTFYYEQYGIGVRDSAMLSILPSIAGIVGSFVAGLSVDTIFRLLARSTFSLQQKQDEEVLVVNSFLNSNLKNDNADDMDNESVIDDATKTVVRKVYQSIALYGGAISLGMLACNLLAETNQNVHDQTTIQEMEPFTAQLYITVSVALQAFCGAGFEGGNQDKAGSKWTGLLYSVTSLPAVLFGTLGVWVTGRVLDVTDQNWGYIFAITAIVNVIGATAFIFLYDSKREFD